MTGGLLLLFMFVMSLGFMRFISSDQAILINGILSTLLLSPFIFAARDNTYTDSIAKVFRQSMPHEFADIGGREMWLGYIDSNKLHYTLYSFPITTSVLVGYISGIGTALGALLLTSLSGG